jgi:hypothetical protein
MERRRDQRLRRIHNEAGMVTPDGMPQYGFCACSARVGRNVTMAPI